MNEGQSENDPVVKKGNPKAKTDGKWHISKNPFAYGRYKIDPERLKNFAIAVKGIREANWARWRQEEKELKEAKMLIKSNCSIVPSGERTGQA